MIALYILIYFFRSLKIMVNKRSELLALDWYNFAKSGRATRFALFLFRFEHFFI